MKANKKAAGAYLRRLREEKNISVTRVASLMDTGEGQIRRIEAGSIDTRTSMMVHLCNLVDGSLDDIAALMLSEQATPEYATRLAERWIQRGSQGKRAADTPVPYSVN